ncbi:MAG: hypothetical protein ACJ8F7_09200 [Gemmataceae bacterium]
MPPRRQPPAPAGESKTGLVVALVIFVLLTIISAALAYMFYADGAAKDKAKQDAEAALKTEKDTRTENELKRSMDEIYIGVPWADRTTFDTLKSNKAYDKYLGNLNGSLDRVGVKWNPTDDKPTDSLIGRIDKLTAEVKNLQDQLANAQSQFASTLTQQQGSADQNGAAMKAAQKAQAEAGKNELAAKSAKQQQLEEALTTIQTMREQMADLNKKREGTEVDFLKRIKALQETIKDKDTQIRKYLAILDQKRENILETDRAKGRVTKVDNRAGIVYLDIGSADFARPQLTFSVLAPQGQNKAAGKRERKGAVEIVKILGDKLSQARITDVTNALQEPILEGDLLFNPAWDPSSRERIALAGLIDLNGDGIDDTQDLIRSLEKQGTQVDAWLDLREIAIKGPGITTTTSYLVLGELPTAGAGLTAGTGPADERDKKKLEMLDKVQQMKDIALKNGIPIVPAKQFLRSIGYPLPKNPAPPNFVPAGVSKSLGGDTPAPAAPKKGKEEKKDDEGK